MTATALGGQVPAVHGFPGPWVRKGAENTWHRFAPPSLVCCTAFPLCIALPRKPFFSKSGALCRQQDPTTSFPSRAVTCGLVYSATACFCYIVTLEKKELEDTYVTATPAMLR